MVSRCFSVGLDGGRFRAGQAANMLHVSMKAPPDGRRAVWQEGWGFGGVDCGLCIWTENFRDIMKWLFEAVFVERCQTECVTWIFVEDILTSSICLSDVGRASNCVRSNDLSMRKRPGSLLDYWQMWSCMARIFEKSDVQVWEASSGLALGSHFCGRCLVDFQ